MTSFQDFFDVDGGSKQGLLAAAYVIGNMVRQPVVGPRGVIN